MDLGLVKTYIFCLEISQNWQKVIYFYFLTLRQKKGCIHLKFSKIDPKNFFLVPRKNFEEDWGVFLETFKKAPLLLTSRMRYHIMTFRTLCTIGAMKLCGICSDLKQTHR